MSITELGFETPPLLWERGPLPTGVRSGTH